MTRRLSLCPGELQTKWLSKAKSDPGRSTWLIIPVMELYVSCPFIKYIYSSDDEQVLPHPPILRGIEKVVSTLKQNGHTIHQWTPYNHSYGHDLINGIYGADGSTVSSSQIPTPNAKIN